MPEYFIAKEDSIGRMIAIKGWETGYFPVLISCKGELIAVIRGGAEHIGKWKN
jgi:hypothetical protein